jgi:hypothetical protein
MFDVADMATQENVWSVQMTAKNLDRCCQARAKTGKRCRAAATEGGLCFFHANPNKPSELGRIGGRSKYGLAGEPPEPLPKLDSAVAVRDMIARLIADVIAGKLSPKIATGVAQLLNLQLRAIDLAERVDLTERMAKLESTDSGERAEPSDGRGMQSGDDGAQPN